MVALALREGRDAGPWVEAASAGSGPTESAPLRDLLDVASLEADPEGRMEAVTSRLVPSLRGEALVMGIVLLRGSAPERWRRDARALLFAPERPYL